MVSTNIFNYISFYYDEKAAKAFSDYAETEHTLYLRVNTIKNNTNSVKTILKDRYGIETDIVPNVPGALKLISGRDVLSRTIEHIMGEFYMQSLSSMIPPIVLDPKPGEKILDLCAAPGSKTTQIAEYMKNQGTLIANEVQLDRIKTLVYNIDRLNVVNAGIIHLKGEHLSKIYDHSFDKILVDAPCSGMGIVQKKEDVNTWWNIVRSQSLGELQYKLLVAAIKMLKTGGELVYSTCTLSLEENELVLNRLLNKFPLELVDIDLPIKNHPGFTKYHEEELDPQLSKTRRILPWEVNSEGFFVAKLRKTEDTTPNEPFPTKSSTWKIVKYSNKEVYPYIKIIQKLFGIDEEHFTKYNYLMKSGNIFLMANDWEDDKLGIFERIGTRFGAIDKNNELTLHTQSAQIFREHITKNLYDLETSDEFKTYIEGGIIRKNIPNGQYVIKYQNNFLGTAIATDGGIKSRFPKARRSQAIIFDPEKP